MHHSGSGWLARPSVGDFHLLFFASFPGALRSGSRAPDSQCPGRVHLSLDSNQIAALRQVTRRATGPDSRANLCDARIQVQNSRILYTREESLYQRVIGTCPGRLRNGAIQIHAVAKDPDCLSGATAIVLTVLPPFHTFTTDTQMIEETPDHAAAASLLSFRSRRRAC